MSVMAMLSKGEVNLSEAAREAVRSAFREELTQLVRDEIKPLRELMMASCAQIKDMQAEIRKTAAVEVIGKERKLNPVKLDAHRSVDKTALLDGICKDVRHLANVKGAKIPTMWKDVYMRLGATTGFNVYAVGKMRIKGRPGGKSYISTVAEKGYLPELRTIIDEQLGR